MSSPRYVYTLRCAKESCRTRRLVRIGARYDIGAKYIGDECTACCGCLYTVECVEDLWGTPS